MLHAPAHHQLWYLARLVMSCASRCVTLVCVLWRVWQNTCWTGTARCCASGRGCRLCRSGGHCTGAQTCTPTAATYSACQCRGDSKGKGEGSGCNCCLHCHQGRVARHARYDECPSLHCFSGSAVLHVRVAVVLHRMGCVHACATCICMRSSSSYLTRVFACWVQRVGFLTWRRSLGDTSGAASIVRTAGSAQS